MDKEALEYLRVSYNNNIITFDEFVEYLKRIK